jgi:membrane associated rhomboid family serine protease
VNHALVVLNLGLFAVTAALAQASPDRHGRFIQALWLNPHALTLWGPVTYAFLHGGLWHAAGNMVFLWVFGPNVEDRFGRVGYLVFYLTAAAASGGVHALFESAPVVGASGAIAGVTGAYLVLFPHTTIRTLFLLAAGVFTVPAWWFIGGQIAFNVLLQGSGLTGGVAVLAHLGGYAFGMGVAMLLLATRVLAREPYDLFTISRQAARRRQFREIRYRHDRSLAAGGHPGAASGRNTPAVSEEAMQARAIVSDRLSADPAAAAAAYKALLEAHSRGSPAALLNRRAQYDLANYLFRSGDHQTAAIAYDLFLSGYPNDHEIPTVRLMLGLISARYLNDPVRAKAEITAAMPGLPQGEHRRLAEELLEELG